LFWGALLLTAGQSKRIRPEWVTTLIGVLVLVLTLLYVRSGFGIAFGAAFGVVMVLGARRLSASINRGVLLVLGLTSCLYAILDIKSDVLDRPHLPSDAYMLSELTGVPTAAWGVMWIGLALLVSFLLFQRAWERAG
jgi:hypothetical protein